MRFVVGLVVAVILGVVGLSIFASTGPAAATVYQTDAHGPKVTFDGKPQMTRAPSFRLLIGTDRKTAKWVDVNALQYAGCSVSNRWSGSLCRKFALPTVGPLTVTWRPITGAVSAALLFTSAFTFISARETR